jgi:hypothetical protein
MAAALGSLDALVFPGGTARTPPRSGSGPWTAWAFIGVRAGTDPGALGGGQISDRAFVIGAREDLKIARQVRDIL